MSLLGILLGKPGTPIPQPAPPAPPVSAGPAPLAPAAAGADSGSASGADGGSTPGTFATTPPATGSATVQRAAAAAGTPITAPATRPAFSAAAAATSSEDEARAHALKMQRQWRLADVFAAIGGGPRAERLIEAASRPGPVEPGSLTEALKALCPQPTLQTSRTV